MNVNEAVKGIFEDSILKKKEFISSSENIETIVKVSETILDVFKNGGKILVLGNGGSAADSQHMAAEFVVRFEKNRKAFPCIALTTDTSIITAGSNDYSFNEIFSRQVEAIGKKEDILVAISTSGKSKNVLKAVQAAKEKGMKTVALTGKDGGELIKKADISMLVKTKNTARVQEIHVTIIHAICKIVEDMAI